MLFKTLYSVRFKIFWLFLLAILAATAASFGVPFSLPELGLDPSWQQALVEGTDNSRIFGKDIIFTFGPLHQLATRQVSENMGPLIIGRIIFGLGWISAVLLAGQKKGLFAALCIAGSAFLAPVGAPEMDTKFFTLCIISILLGYIYATEEGTRVLLRRVDPFILLLGILVTVISMTLVKLSYIGAAVPTLGSGLFFITLPRRDGVLSLDIIRLLASLLTLVVTLPLVWLATGSGSLVYLLNFFSGENLSIVLGYTDAMSYGLSFDSIYRLGTYILLSLVGGIVCAKLLVQSFYNCHPNKTTINYFYLFVPLLGLSTIFWVVFKASFVRDDGMHVPIAAMTGITFLLVTMGLFRDSVHESFGLTDKPRLMFGPIFILMIATIAHFATFSLSYLSIPRTSLSEYAMGLKEFSLSIISANYRKLISEKRTKRLSELKEQSEKYSIPVGKTADVISWNISSLLANNINYKPRPVPQSYSTYSKDLQLANSKFYQDTTSSPDYVVIDIEDIDGRFPLSPDAPAILNILKKYEYSHQGSKGSLIFEKHKNISGYQRSLRENCSKNKIVSEVKWQRNGKLTWETNPVAIPRSEKYLSIITGLPLTATASRTTLSTLYRPFPVYIDYLDSHEKVVASFRILPKALDGFVLWPAIENNDIFYRLLVANKSVNNYTPSQLDSNDNLGLSQALSFRFRAGGLGKPFHDSIIKMDTICLVN